MASKIEWTQETWNPIVGCSVVSPGCTNCYAMRHAARLARMGQERYAGLTVPTKAGPVWTGEVRTVAKALLKPLYTGKPTTIFVNSMSDLFHPRIMDHEVDQVFAVMLLTPEHVYQVLTKRSDQMRAYISDPATFDRVVTAARRIKAETGRGHTASFDWPANHIWLGVSAEDARRWDDRVPDLRATPASVRFVSVEPMLGPIWADMAGLDWIIVGGESGKGSRPMHADWARSIRDQCATAGVPFFFKQHGDWIDEQLATAQHCAPGSSMFDVYGRPTGPRWHFYDADDVLGGAAIRIGKKAAGRLLDGVTHDAMPDVP